MVGIKTLVMINLRLSSNSIVSNKIIKNLAIGLCMLKEPFKSEGSAPLHIAAGIGNSELFQFILENSKDKNPKHVRNEDNPLHWAALAGHTDICRILLEVNQYLHGQDIKCS